MIRSGGNDTGP